MKRALVFSAVAAIVLGVAGAALPTSSDVWQRLRRPLHMPGIDSGAPCPVSGELESSRVYPALPREEGKPVLRFDYPARPGTVDYGSPWSGEKVTWVVRGNYRGPVLIR